MKKYVRNMKKYVENMEEDAGSMKKYAGNMKKYVGFMKVSITFLHNSFIFSSDFFIFLGLGKILSFFLGSLALYIGRSDTPHIGSGLGKIPSFPPPLIGSETWRNSELHPMYWIWNLVERSTKHSKV